VSYPAPRAALPRFVQKGRGETLDLPVYAATGLLASATGGTYALYDSDGSEVVAPSAVTVTAGVATFALPSTFADGHDLPLDAWRERWVLTGVSGAPSSVTFERQVLVCRVAPVACVTAEDLYRMHPQWRRQLPASRPAYAEPYDSPIVQAWEELLGRLLGDQHLPNRTLNWWALAIVHRYWAAHIVCRDFATDAAADSRWGRLSDEYWKRSQSEYEHHLGLQVDADEDGVEDHPGRLEGAEPQLFLTSMPTTWWRE
jgi:hypothetical protein